MLPFEFALFRHWQFQTAHFFLHLKTNTEPTGEQRLPSSAAFSFNDFLSMISRDSPITPLPHLRSTFFLSLLSYTELDPNSDLDFRFADGAATLGPRDGQPWVHPTKKRRNSRSPSKIYDPPAVDRDRKTRSSRVLGP